MTASASSSGTLTLPVFPLRRRLAWMAAVAALYVIGGRLGLSAAMVDAGAITLVWPPTGIAIAALLRGGMGLWPSV